MTNSPRRSRRASSRRENGSEKTSHDHVNGEDPRPNDVSSNGGIPLSGGRPRRTLRIRVRIPPARVSSPSPNETMQSSQEKAVPSRTRKKRNLSHEEEAKADTVQSEASKKRRTSSTRTLPKRKAKQHPSSASDAPDVKKKDKTETRSTPDMETEDEAEVKSSGSTSPVSKTVTTRSKSATQSHQDASAKVPAQNDPVETLPLPPPVDVPPDTAYATIAPSTAAASSRDSRRTPSPSSSRPVPAHKINPVSRSKVTKEHIRSAIPEDASCVVHIMDRRVNFDACHPDASYYTLLRSWVQDDPFRQIPPPCCNIFDRIPLPSERRMEYFPAMPKTESVKDTGKCDVLSSMETKETDTSSNMETDETDSKVPSVSSLRDELIVKSKRLKRTKQREDKAWMEASRQSLKSIGIDLPLST